VTDAQRQALLKSALDELRLTRDGFDTFGGHWRRAWPKLERLYADLEPDPLPLLGPVIRGGKSVLNVSLTHNTDGIYFYPAWDDGWTAGREVIAPEDLEVIRPYTSSNPGAAFYARGRSSLRYWFGHLTSSPRVGTRFVKGQKIGAIAFQPNGKSHVHTGVNVELLLGAGKQLLYGRTGRGPDYTTGAPTIGAQLRQALDT